MIGCGCCGGTGADGGGPELGGPVGLVAVVFGTADVGIGWKVTAVFVFTAVA